MKPELQNRSLLDLQLDDDNPRFPASERGQGQRGALRILVERFKLDELAESILSSGFLTFDPLVGYRSNSKPNAPVVIREGNRRVATLKLLIEPALAPERNRKTWDDFSQRLTPESRRQITSVDVLVFDNKEHSELSAYVGFRHVTGVLKWPAFEKAAFIAELVDNGWSFNKVARRLGSYPKHVERHYVAYQVVQQAHATGLRGADRMEGRFGVVLRALNSPGVNNFLKLAYSGKPQTEPVKADKDSYGRFVEMDIRDGRRRTRGSRFSPVEQVGADTRIPGGQALPSEHRSPQLRPGLDEVRWSGRLHRRIALHCGGPDGRGRGSRVGAQRCVRDQVRGRGMRAFLQSNPSSFPGSPGQVLSPE